MSAQESYILSQNNNTQIYIQICMVLISNRVWLKCVLKMSLRLGQYRNPVCLFGTMRQGKARRTAKAQRCIGILYIFRGGETCLRGGHTGTGYPCMIMNTCTVQYEYRYL